MMVLAARTAMVVADMDIVAVGAQVLLGALTFGAILMFFVGLTRQMNGGATGISARLNEFGAREAPLGSTQRRGRSRGRAGPGIYGSIDRAVASRGFAQRLSTDLARADLKITVGEFIVARVVFASLGGLIGYAIPISGHVVLAALLAMTGYFVPRMYVTSAKNKRLRAFNAQLADTIGLLSSALRSGYSLLQAMELVAREGPSPVSGEFERVVREVGLGLSPEEALSNLIGRMQSDDLELMVTAINVQREVGGNLAEVLDTIANTIRERVKLKGEIRVLTSQQQYSGYIVGLLPVALSLLLFVINPTYMESVFTKTHWCGWTMFGCSGAMIVVGFILIQRIVDIHV
jgi:tight adherence protein B